ncbi:MAG: allophanate hydrolase [Flavobacteriaceae bacterium]|nr:allophanate hydrolase [Flavobacteriaceae bacterium]|tara:strand:+ start:694 stop:1539 length:846 start_codon:yes stop_codon:yes gene_type:complete
MLKVLQPGFYSTIQDYGRFGYRDYGVPVSGVMDSYSAQFANALLGNTNEAALIEMTMVGGKFQFLEPTTIVVSGAFMNPKLNDMPIEQHKLIHIHSNDVLHFAQVEQGFRTYLAIKGGFESDVLLGSRSQYNPVTSNNTIHKGELVPYQSFSSLYVSNSKVKFDDSILKSNILDVFKGPEFDRLSEKQKQQIENGEFKVSKNNNRMAYQLEPMVENDLEPILSAPVLPGTVQLTPNGNLIVLTRDCQTTGGYPRVLQLMESAINMLAQKTTGNTLKFRLKE